MYPFGSSEVQNLHLVPKAQLPTVTTLQAYDPVPNIPLCPLLQQNKASLPGIIYSMALKVPHIHLEIIQQTPGHLLARGKPQIRIAGTVNAHVGPHQPISARRVETTVLLAV